MLKRTVVATAGALAFAVFPPAVTDPAAMAAAPKCKNKANKYVACTDKLKAKTQHQKSRFDAFLRIEGINGETEARRGPRLRTR